MADEENKEKNEEKEFSVHIRDLVEDKIKKLVEGGIQVGNVDYFSKLVDIHKDMANEEYWKIKKEVLKNDVRKL